MDQPTASGRQLAGPGLALPSALVKIAGVVLSLSLTFIGLTAITFVIGRVMPADPVLAIVGDRARRRQGREVSGNLPRFRRPVRHENRSEAPPEFR